MDCPFEEQCARLAQSPTSSEWRVQLRAPRRSVEVPFYWTPGSKIGTFVCGSNTMLSANHWSLRKMVDEERLNHWFREEVLPLEGALVRFIGRNWRVAAIRHRGSGTAWWC